MALYAFPRVGRAGLGNGLLPWARAEIFAERTGAAVLAPRWTSLRIGPYLRGEPEKRRYGGFFHSRQHVHGWRALAVRGLGRTLPESQAAAARAAMSARPTLVTFSGLDGLFEPLRPYRALIRQRLWEMTRPALRPGAVAGAFAAMHVRRGDITRQGFTARELEDTRIYTPLDWFIAMARAVRASPALRELPIVVFTDGSAEELAPLFALEGVRLRERAPAISHLWEMSRAELLFATGHSTFGMWASFLGCMPTYYAPGKMQQRVQPDAPHAVEREVPGDERAAAMIAPAPERP